MAKRAGISIKHMQIDKANTLVVVLVSLAAFMSTFAIFATRALLSQRDYQSRVIKEKTIARNQLEENIKAAGPLTDAYKKFVSQTTNIIGGNAVGIGNQDGDNAKIVLDALPSKYDFPAVVSGLEKLLTSGSFRIESITGTDDEINQQASTINELVEIPFNASFGGPYGGLKEAIVLLERSIRPFSIDELQLTGSDNEMKLTIKAKTYYQPEKTLKITTKEVK